MSGPVTPKGYLFIQFTQVTPCSTLRNVISRKVSYINLMILDTQNFTRIDYRLILKMNVN